MTVKEAEKKLNAPLKFGDLEQIQARQTLDQISACAEAVLACEHGHVEECEACDGKGDHECDHCGAVHRCGECEGRGSVRCRCFSWFARDVLKKALKDPRISKEAKRAIEKAA